jgi:prepilin-type processing-associated H-X9-DG protein
MITITETQTLLPLEEVPSDGRTYINASVWFVDRDGYRVVFRWHEPLYRIALSDRVHLRLVAVSLRQSQLATQEEIARAFGHTVATQRRWERRYQEQGIDGLLPKRGSGRRRELNKSQEASVRKWFDAGISNVEMARRLAVGESTIRRTLKRLGLRRTPEHRQQPLPVVVDDRQEGTLDEAAGVGDRGPAAEAEPSPKQAVEASQEPPSEVAPLSGSLTIDHDPRDRSGDRALARLGLLEDAVPRFADAEAVPRAGVLLAVPLLVGHGLLETFQQVYGSLRPSFYGLRTTVVTLFLCALLRIKRPEHLKEYRPSDLGQILGLDRAPEVKTIRRKLSRLAAAGQGKVLMDELARRRIEEAPGRVAFLYVDGHVREYHGKYRLSKAKKAQRQVVTAAATDTWVHDAAGEPLLVVTSEVNAKLTQVLEPILEDVKRLVPPGRRITVIFDRGGYSAKLFARLTASGFDVITYRKGKVRKLARSSFTKQRRKIDGRWTEYELRDRPRVRVGRLRAKRKRTPATEPQYLWLREVRVLREDGRQTSILTSRTDLHAVEVAYRIFHRWRQENFFKYLREEFALDALVEYGAEGVSEGIDRPNPQWTRITKRLKQAKAQAARLRAELGEQVADNDEGTRRTMRGFKIAHADLRRQLEQAEAQVQRLFEKRKTIPKRIPASDLEVLKTEKKLIMDSIKMAAYQVETELLNMLQDHYARTGDEGRTLLHAAFQSPARLEVCGDELRVTIAAQSAPHRTAALAALCAELDAISIRFPGTSLRLQLVVEPKQPIIS